MTTYTVKSYIPRGTTCQSIRYKIQKQESKSCYGDFGNMTEAKKACAFHNLKDYMTTLGFTLQIEDQELRNKIVLI